jgi:hypothetical protein
VQLWSKPSERFDKRGQQAAYRGVMVVRACGDAEVQPLSMALGHL